MEKIHIISGQSSRTIQISNLSYEAVAKDNIIGIINMTKAEPLYTPMDINNITAVSYSGGVLTITLASSVPAIASNDKLFVKLYFDDSSVSSAVTAIDNARQAIIGKLNEGGTPNDAKQAILQELAVRLGTAGEIPTKTYIDEAELRIKNAMPTDYATAASIQHLHEALTGSNQAGGGIIRKYIVPAMRGGYTPEGQLLSQQEYQVIMTNIGEIDSQNPGVILQPVGQFGGLLGSVSVGETYYFPLKPEIGYEGVLYLYGYSAEAEEYLQKLHYYVPVSVDLNGVVWQRNQNNNQLEFDLSTIEYAEVPAGARVTLSEEREFYFTNPETGEKVVICTFLLYRVEEPEAGESASLTELKTLLNSMPKVRKMTIDEYAAANIHDAGTIYMITDNSGQKVITKYIGNTPIPLLQSTVLGEMALGNSLLL